MSTSVSTGLQVRGLTASYGPVTALDDVDITAEPGRITAVLGANGAGKTTLLRTISGLVRPSAGQVLLGERDMTRAPAEMIARAGVAHVPEGRGVITELTVEENLRLGALLGSSR
jgi:branched-chain amino acid transport system ATP-binding protein